MNEESLTARKKNTSFGKSLPDQTAALISRRVQTLKQDLQEYKFPAGGDKALALAINAYQINHGGKAIGQYAQRIIETYHRFKQ